MNTKTLLKNTTTIFIALLFVAIPLKASAQFIVSDPANTAVNAGILAAQTPNTATNVITTAQTILATVKDIVLDGIAFGLINHAIDRMGQSTVDWINNDFKTADGHKRPAFLEDPYDFFLGIGGVADEAIGKFIEGEVPQLCGSFGGVSNDIALRLNLKYRAPFVEQQRCTVTSILEEANTTIEGFQNKFEDGGWKAWVEFTTVPHNNPYGSYFAAETELRARVAQTNLIETQKLDWGKGLLSYETCDSSGFAIVTQGDAASQAFDDETGFTTSQYWQDTNTGEIVGPVTDPSSPPCSPSIATPGSILENQLNSALSSGVRRLEIADEVDEIIGALVANLFSKIFEPNGPGLRGVRGGGGNLGGGGGSGNPEDFTSGALVDAIDKQIAIEQKYISALRSIESAHHQITKGSLPNNTTGVPYPHITTEEIINSFDTCENSDDFSQSDLTLIASNKSRIQSIARTASAKINRTNETISRLRALREEADKTQLNSDDASALWHVFNSFGGLFHTSNDITAEEVLLNEMVLKIMELYALAGEQACVDIPDGPPAPETRPFVDLSFVTKDSYKPGDTVTLKWNLAKVEDCKVSATPSNTFWTVDIPTTDNSGERAIVLLDAAVQTYSVTCVDILEQDNLEATHAELTDSVQIRLTEPVTLTSNVTTALSGSSVLLSWNTLGVNSCIASSEPEIFDWSGSKISTDGIHTEGITLNSVYTRAENQSFTLSCEQTTSGNTLTETIDVFISDNDCETCTGASGPPATIPAITVSPLSSHTTESGGVAYFRVALTTEPSSPVTIAMISSNTAEGTISVSEVVLNSGNWNNGVQVTVTGVDDTFRDGPTTYRIILAAAVSGDEAYGGLDANDAVVINDDNESADSGGGGGGDDPKNGS